MELRAQAVGADRGLVTMFGPVRVADAKHICVRGYTCVRCCQGVGGIRFQGPTLLGLSDSSLEGASLSRASEGCVQELALPGTLQ